MKQITHSRLGDIVVVHWPNGNGEYHYKIVMDESGAVLFELVYVFDYKLGENNVE